MWMCSYDIFYSYHCYSYPFIYIWYYFILHLHFFFDSRDPRVSLMNKKYKGTDDIFTWCPGVGLSFPTVEVNLDCGLRPLQIASADQWTQVKIKKIKNDFDVMQRVVIYLCFFLFGGGGGWAAVSTRLDVEVMLPADLCGPSEPTFALPLTQWADARQIALLLHLAPLPCDGRAA